MADQTRKPKPKKEEEQAKAQEETTTEEKTEDIDDLLDEIDEVLEANSEEFVRSFIQKGGQALVPVAALSGSITTRTTMALGLLVYGWWLARKRAA